MGGIPQIPITVADTKEQSLPTARLMSLLKPQGGSEARLWAKLSTQARPYVGDHSLTAGLCKVKWRSRNRYTIKHVLTCVQEYLDMLNLPNVVPSSSLDRRPLESRARVGALNEGP